MCSESLRSAVVGRRTDDPRRGVQLELEGIEAEGQSLADGLQRRLLQAPELVEGAQAIGTARPFDLVGLGRREESPSELLGLQIPRLVFEIDTDPMRRRPCPEQAGPAGREAEPEVRFIAKGGSPAVSLMEGDLRRPS